MVRTSKIATLALACALWVTGCAPAPAATTVGKPETVRLDQVRRQLEETFARRMQAYREKDYATLVAQISPDYSAVRPDGSRMTRDDLAGYIRQNLDRWVRILRQSNVIESLRLENGNAIADVRQSLSRIQIIDGREATVESRVLQTETWTPTSQGWKLLAVRDERDQSVMVNGKPLR
jgi:Domain of unknown function (DUF4440)